MVLLRNVRVNKQNDYGTPLFFDIKEKILIEIYYRCASLFAVEKFVLTDKITYLSRNLASYTMSK